MRGGEGLSLPRSGVLNILHPGSWLRPHQARLEQSRKTTARTGKNPNRKALNTLQDSSR